MTAAVAFGTYVRLDDPPGLMSDIGLVTGPTDTQALL